MILLENMSLTQKVPEGSDRGVAANNYFYTWVEYVGHTLAVTKNLEKIAVSSRQRAKRLEDKDFLSLNISILGHKCPI